LVNEAKINKYFKIYRLLVFGYLIIGIFARFYKLDFQSLWNDELATYTWLSGRLNSITKVILSCKADVHPSFYFLFANFWLKYVVYSEMSLRVLSAIFGSPYLYFFIAIIFLAFMLFAFKKIKAKDFSFLNADSFYKKIVLLLIWIVVTYLLPYFKSIFSASLLTPRNTIVTLPAIILLVSFIISSIKAKNIQILFLTYLAITSFIYLFFFSGYYTQIFREQWRSVVMTVIKSNYKNTLIASGRDTLYFQEYFNLLNSDKKIILFSKETLIKAFKNKENRGIWVLTQVYHY